MIFYAVKVNIFTLYFCEICPKTEKKYNFISEL